MRAMGNYAVHYHEEKSKPKKESKPMEREIERLSEYAVSVAIPVKDLTTAKKIVELIGL